MLPEEIGDGVVTGYSVLEFENIMPFILKNQVIHLFTNAA